MKRIFKIALCVALIMCIFTVCANASFENIDTYKEEFELQKVVETIDEKSAEILSDLGIDEISFGSLFNISPKRIFQELINIFTGALKEPLKYLIKITGLIIIISFLSGNGKNQDTILLVGGSIVSLLTAVPLWEIISLSFSVLESLGIFTTAFAGAFCAIVSSSGNIAVATSYLSFSIFSNTFFSNILSGVSQPLIKGICSLGFLSCLDIFKFTEKASEKVKKVYIFLLSLIGTAFSGIITVKGILGGSADTITSKGMRFVVGKSLPVVGGVVSETYGSLVSGLSLIKNTVGIFGIITVIIMVLPTFIELILWELIFDIIISLAEIFSLDGIKSLMGIFKDSLTLLIATITMSAVIFIVSVGIVIAVKGGMI